MREAQNLENHKSESLSALMIQYAVLGIFWINVLLQMINSFQLAEL